MSLRLAPAADTVRTGDGTTSGEHLRPEWARRGVVALYAVVGVLVLAYTVSTAFRPDQEPSTVYDGWIGNLAYTGCALLCAARVVLVRRHRLAWALIALSLVLFEAGNLMWTTVVRFWDPVPYPSIQDAFFLAFYPVAFVGVGVLARTSLPRWSRAVWLDGLIAALGVAALVAAVVIAPISNANRGDAATVATNLAYPIGDLVLVAMVVGVFALHGWRPGRQWWVFGAGLVTFAVADFVYVLRVTADTYQTGTLLDSVWLVGTFLMATAAWQADAERRTAARESQPIAVPAFFLLTSVAILIVGSWSRVLPLAVALASATLLAAVVRMGHAYRQLRLLAETRRQARTDELTGLPNRRLFYENLRLLLELGPGQERVGVLMIDLNRFKEINDTLGHRVGDDVLRELGPRLAAVGGGDGTVARLGGDEFGLLLAPLEEPAAAARLAERVCEVLRQPIEVEGMTLRVDASIGIAVAPDHGRVADALIQRADVAMYEAKRAHHAWELYSPLRDTYTRDRLELLEDLRGAIERRELVVHYQPKLDLMTGRIVGAEALVRWAHPTRGLLMPGSFLGLVEQSGLIGPLAMTVLDEAVAQQARWVQEGVDIAVAVNLSVANLRDEDLPDAVGAVLRQSGVPPGRLTLEITEDCLMADVDQSQRILHRLRELGLELSVDDYGTGFSSLAYLRSLPVSELKLDRAFLAEVPDDARAVSIIRSTVELAHALGLRIVAEGVETGDALALVTALGCDAAQGYLVGRPAPASELLSPHAPQPVRVPIPPAAAPRRAAATRRSRRSAS